MKNKKKASYYGNARRTALIFQTASSVGFTRIFFNIKTIQINLNINKNTSHYEILYGFYHIKELIFKKAMVSAELKQKKNIYKTLRVCSLTNFLRILFEDEDNIERTGKNSLSLPPMSLTMSLYMSLTMSLSLSLNMSLSIYLSITPSLSLSQSLSLSLSLRLSS